MRTSTRIIGAFAATAMLAAAPLNAAMAQDIDAALERLKALVEQQGATIEWDNAEISGDDAELVGVEVGSAEGMVPIGNISLTDISETDEGFRVEELLIPSYTMETPEGSVVVEGVSMTGVMLPNEGEDVASGGFLFYESADVERVAAIVDGTEVFTLSNMHIDVTPADGEAPLEFTGGAENFTVDLSVIEDPAQLAVVQALGYEQLSGDFELAGSWQPSNGRLAISQYDLTVADVGTLGFTFDIGGYTPEFIAALQEIQQQMEENPEGDTSQHGLAMLGLMQQLTLHGAELAFTDDGLTQKVLGYLAEQQGVEPSDVANQAKAVLPFALAQLNSPDLATMVTEAVSAFLDDPQSIRISLAPENPVPFAMIVAGAMASPQELPGTLGLEVAANQ